MAFTAFDFDSIKSGVYGTSYAHGIFMSRRVTADSKTKIVIVPNWLNLGNYSTSGTSSTSGTGGTTIIAAGNYTWIG